MSARAALCSFIHGTHDNAAEGTLRSTFWMGSLLNVMLHITCVHCGISAGVLAGLY